MIFNPSSISDILSFFYGMEGEFTTFFFTSKVSRNLFYDGDEGRGCWGVLIKFAQVVMGFKAIGFDSVDGDDGRMSFKLNFRGTF